MVRTPTSLTHTSRASFNGGRGNDRIDISPVDTQNLRLLVPFLSPSHTLTLEFFHRGGSPRKRWTLEGGVATVDAAVAGLSSCLVSLMCDASRLERALNNLSTSVLKKSEGCYSLEEEFAGRIRDSLSASEASLWKRQALIVAYRAISWKNVEPRLVSQQV